MTEFNERPQASLKVLAKFWGKVNAIEATAHLGGQTHRMERVNNSQVWQADVPGPGEGAHTLKVYFTDTYAKVASEEICLAAGLRTERKFVERDQDNGLEAWPEHGLLAIQLGPNKNRKKR